MNRIALFTVTAAAAGTVTAATLFGGLFADTVVAVNLGPGLQFGLPEFVLGEPQAEGLFAGSTDVYSLGINGSIDLEMDTPMFDGPGVDLIVYENPFFITGTTNAFIEAMYVEVSTNGIAWARFPSRYHGEPGPFPPFAACPVEWYEGLAGASPASGGPIIGVDPLNVVAGGGDAFDFAWLADEPNVLNGSVMLDVIKFVRLIDVGPTSTDSFGTVIVDHAFDPEIASADPDAVIGVNNGINGSIETRPKLEMELVNGFLSIEISDEDGFNDVKFGLQASANGLPIDFYAIVPFFVPIVIDADTVQLVAGPIPPGTFDVVLKVAAVDTTGQTRGDVVHIH